MHQYKILGRLSHRAVSLLVWLAFLSATVGMPSFGLENVYATDSVSTARLDQARLRSEAPTETVIYVDKRGNGSSGADWDNAFTNLQEALDIAEDGDQIWVAAGVYTPTHQILLTDTRSATFTPVDGVQIFGGFKGDETSLSQREWQAHPSILSGDLNGDDVVDDFINNGENSYHVVTASNLNRIYTRLDGFIIQGGNANSSNQPDNYGGGLFNDSFEGSPSMANLIFYKNYAEVGGGLYNVNADAMLVNVAWIGNRSDFGGAIRNLDCSPTLVNVLFSGNTANITAGAIYTTRGEPLIRNCAVVNNSAGNNAGGILNDDKSHLYLFNCILWGNKYGDNTPDQVYNEYKSPDPATNSYTELHISLYQGGCSGFGTTCYVRSTSANPLFVDPPGLDGIIGTLDDNLRLNNGSPAINYGGNNFVPLDELDVNYNDIITETLPYDLDNNNRINGTVDLGPL